MAENVLAEVSDFLSNVKSNNQIALAMSNNTDANGLITELTVTTAAESNIYAVFEGTFEHFKNAHAKKQLELNYVKGAEPENDTYIYDIIVKYNKSTSDIDKTVLCSINLTSFVSLSSAGRTAASTGKLANSLAISIDWDKLKLLSSVTQFLTKYNEFNNEVRNALISVTPFTRLR